MLTVNQIMIKAVTLIKSAKKYEEKGKKEKQIKSMKKPKTIIKSNKKNPNNADTLKLSWFYNKKTW